MHQALLKAYISTSAYSPLSDEAIEIYSQPWLGKTGQAAFYRQISQMNEKYTNEIEELYEQMDCPVTVLWGQEDQWIPYEMGIRLAQLISDKECTLIPQSGHLMQEDRPEAVVAAILKTIKI
jgi:pimeloyl-ACP methyl ester carboxylesterase